MNDVEIHSILSINLDWQTIFSQLHNAGIENRVLDLGKDITIQSETALLGLLCNKSIYSAVADCIETHRFLPFGFIIAGSLDVSLAIMQTGLGCRRILSNSGLVKKPREIVITIDTFDKFKSATIDLGRESNPKHIRFLGCWLFDYFKKMKLGDAFRNYIMTKDGTIEEI